MSIISPEDLPEFQLRAHLQAGGFLGSFTDVFGALQSAPDVQVGNYDERGVAANSRILLIRSANAGGPSDEFVQYQNVLIALSGLGRFDDWVITKGRLSQMHQWLLDNHRADCIINLDDLSDVTGPFFTQSNRPVAEINFRLVLERP